MSRLVHTFDSLGNPVARDSSAAEDANFAATITKARAAFAANAAFLALPSPTAAQVRDQTRLLTREMNALLRLFLGELSDVSDT